MMRSELTMKKSAKQSVLALLAACLLAAPAFAGQYAPAPRTAPHTPVNREAVPDRHAPPPRDVQGQAMVIDGEKLRIGDVDLRLFGIVPPQLSANFGPQARAALDDVMGGGQAIACHVRDRDHDGRLLATCRTPNGTDPALELLRRGLAVAARGSIADTELAQPYVTAEAAAESAHAGLWSLAPTAGASLSAVQASMPKIDSVKPVVLPTADVQAKTASAILAAKPPAVVAEAAPSVRDADGNPGFFTRYQILIACGLMLATALSILAALTAHRVREKRDEMKALAAALRGELLAARAVCATRAKGISSDADDRAANWPRIRSTLYQAYVGRLGFLGAELARQVASIYGQASDYASYYGNNGEVTGAGQPKKQALQMLAAHIDEVLPRLASIEQSGRRFLPPVYAPSTMPSAQPFPEPAAPLMAIAASKPVVADKNPGEPVAAAADAIEARLRAAVRHLRERFAEMRVASENSEEPVGDYATYIEEDPEHFTLGGEDEVEAETEAAPESKTGSAS